MSSLPVTNSEAEQVFKKYEQAIHHPECIDDEFLTDIYLLTLATSGSVKQARKKVQRYLELQKELQKLIIN